MASQAYTAKKDTLAATLQNLVPLLIGAAADTSSDDLPDLDVNSIMKLAAWSRTVQFDRASMEILDPCITILRGRFGAMEQASGPCSCGKIPMLLMTVYNAGCTAVKPGADTIIPQLHFLLHDSKLAEQCFKLCESVFGVVAPFAAKLTSLYADAVSKAAAAAEKAALTDTSDSDFVEAFNMKTAEDSLKNLQKASANAATLLKMSVNEIDMTFANKAKAKVQAGINRNALLQLLGRKSIRDPVKGVSHRKQMAAVWSAATLHKLEEHFSTSLIDDIKEVLQGGATDDDVGDAGKPVEPAAEKAAPDKGTGKQIKNESTGNASTASAAACASEEAAPPPRGRRRAAAAEPLAKRRASSPPSVRGNID